MDAIENIFSQFVVGLTLPKPTLVKLVNVKNKAVMYFDFKSGPLSELFSWYGMLYFSAKWSNQLYLGSGNVGRSM
jgi:hypothetical protein